MPQAVFFIDTLADCREATLAITARQAAKLAASSVSAEAGPITLAAKAIIDAGEATEHLTSLLRALSLKLEGVELPTRRRRADRAHFAGSRMVAIVPLRCTNSHNYTLNQVAILSTAEGICVKASGSAGNTIGGTAGEWRYATPEEVNAFYDSVEAGNPMAAEAFVANFRTTD